MTKLKRVNSLNLSPETLNAISEILTSMDSIQVNFPRSQLKSLFELQFQNESLNFTKLSETNMTYKDGRVQAIYLSFKAAFLAHTTAIQRTLSKLNKSCVNSPYIIGMQVEDNTVQFGFRPFKHKDVGEAKEQAKVLADRHGKPYTVFGALDTVKPEGVKHPRQAMISETRQGPKGRLKSYTAGVMRDLQALTKEVDISKEVFPSGIKFLPDGTFAVTFYNDDKIIVESDMVAAVQTVEKMMNGYKQSKITKSEAETCPNYKPDSGYHEHQCEALPYTGVNKMSVTERQIAIIKFLQETSNRFSRTKIGFMTLDEAREYCKQTNSIVSHHYNKDNKSYLWFSDNHLYGYKDEKNQLKDCVPSSSHLPSTAVARPGLESGIVSNLDDWMVVHFHPEYGDVLINDFNEFVKFIDEHNLYTGD